MVEHRTCDYTGEEIEPGTGIMYVRNNGSILHFVDSKAEKNYKLGREPRDLEWTGQGRRGKGPADAATEPQDDVHEDREEGDDGEEVPATDADDVTADGEDVPADEIEAQEGEEGDQ